ncbi:MAG: STAS domain-containing protein [Rhizobacter sp.]
MKTQNTALETLLKTDRDIVIEEWVSEFKVGGSKGIGSHVAAEARSVLEALTKGISADGDPARFDADAWSALRDVLESVSAARAAQGSTSGETSRFMLALKKPIFDRLQATFHKDTAVLAENLWWLSLLVDRAAQYTVDAYQRSREEIINRQQQELLELSTPVVKLWEGVLAVPMIGTLDSARTQLVMETLLQRIVETGSELAIVDITGVPTVDTLVAQHLLKTVTAIRLMGADCIISGIRPQIAQTIVHLGIDLQGITTKATLADALSLALKQTGYVVTRPKAA